MLSTSQRSFQARKPVHKHNILTEEDIINRHTNRHGNFDKEYFRDKIEKEEEHEEEEDVLIKLEREAKVTKL